MKVFISGFGNLGGDLGYNFGLRNGLESWRLGSFEVYRWDDKLVGDVLSAWSDFGTDRCLSFVHIGE